jgi:hypothetical protein
LKKEICEDLETLQNYFESYFYLHGIKDEPWVGNPFRFDINCVEDADLAKDELINLMIKTYCSWSLTQKNLREFWCFLIEAYPRLVN